MQFKHKLIYFALGCAFVVIGQVLLNVLTPKVTAQGKKTDAEFDTVTCQSLRVVDKLGKVRAQLEVVKGDLGDNIIQLFNDDDIPIYRVSATIIGGIVTVCDNEGKRKVGLLGGDKVLGGNVNVYNNDGTSVASMSSFGNRGGVFVGKGQKKCVEMNVDSNGCGKLTVYDKDEVINVIMGAFTNGGMVSVFGNKSENYRKYEAAHMFADSYGGRVDVFGKGSSKSRVSIGVAECGGGGISTWDKHGYRLR